MEILLNHYIPSIERGIQATTDESVIVASKQKKVIKRQFCSMSCMHVFAMKSVQNLKSFGRSSQDYFVLVLFCSLHS
jgi:hypothetical protein